MSDSENKYEYRSYTTEEIRRLLSICDERERAIVLLLSSTGIRVGAVHPLRLKDLKRWKIDKQDAYIYQIQVYSSSSKYRYYCFCTPECAVAIDNYLELRQRYGENLIKTENGWAPQNAHLIIRAFNRKSFDFIPIPIQCRTTITTNIIVPKLEAINLRNRKLPSDKRLQENMAYKRGDLHPCHSFRIFAITQMQRAKVDKTIREMLVGHSTGLDSVYYKASEEEMLFEFSKAFELLSIDNESKLKAKIKVLEEKNNTNENLIDQRLVKKDNEVEELMKTEEDRFTKLEQKYQKDIESLKYEMETKFQKLFDKIDIKNLI
jgi:integrase